MLKTKMFIFLVLFKKYINKINNALININNIILNKLPN